MKTFIFPRFSILMLVFTGFCALESVAQAPDWMFALEGTYVGRLEISEDNVKVTNDVRLDGLRNGVEDGFVLQFMVSNDNGIQERVEMWGWDLDNKQVLITTLEDNKPTVSAWYAEKEGTQVVLSRGGSDAGRAVLIRLRIQRLPGQLRLDRLINDGDGQWQLQERYVLDEETITD